MNRIVGVFAIVCGIIFTGCESSQRNIEEESAEKLGESIDEATNGDDDK